MRRRRAKTTAVWITTCGPSILSAGSAYHCSDKLNVLRDGMIQGGGGGEGKGGGVRLGLRRQSGEEKGKEEEGEEGKG